MTATTVRPAHCTVTSTHHTTPSQGAGPGPGNGVEFLLDRADILTGVGDIAGQRKSSLTRLKPLRQSVGDIPGTVSCRAASDTARCAAITPAKTGGSRGVA